jgi:prefoldin beta subunit
MSLSPEAQAKVQELQVLEHNMQNLLMQKQQVQLELSETVNAFEEVKKTSEAIYKMVGSILVVVEKEKTLAELEDKKKILELRLDSLTKQERLFDAKARELQTDVRKMFEQSPSVSASKKQ